MAETPTPRTLECITVIAACWGWFVLSAIVAISGPGEAAPEPITTSGLLTLVAYELFAASAIGYGLFRRGWQIRDFPLDIRWKTTLGGLALVLAAGLVNELASALGVALGGNIDALNALHPNPPISAPIALTVSLINGSYEELFLIGYLFKALERHAPLFIIGVSVLLRMLAHLYQGPVGALAMGAIGLLFAAVFAYTRKLWPIIVAHVVLDAAYLLS